MPLLPSRRARRGSLVGICVVPWLLTLPLLLAACQEGASLPGWLSGTQPPPEPVAAPEPEPEPEPAPPLVVALAPEPPPEIDSAPIEDIIVGPARVGFLVPLTGAAALQGHALLDAAQMALFDIGSDIVLLPRDTKGRPETAAAAAAEVIDQGAQLILGPLFSNSVAAVAPLADEAGIRVVAFSTDPRVAGDGRYLIGFTSAQQVRRLVSFAAGAGIERFALLAPDSAYGRAVAAQYGEAVAGVGGTLSRAEFYAADGSDAQAVVRRLADYDRRHAALREQVATLEARDDELARQSLARLEGLDTLGAAPFDALLIADGGQSLRAVAPILPYYDIDPTEVRLMGTGLWDDPRTLAEPTLAGGWFVSPPPETRARFDARFEAIYGAAPPRLATLAYDATALAGVLGAQPLGADFSDAALLSPNGFAGVDGVFRFGTDGLAERGLAVMQVMPEGVAAVLDPARRSFQTVAAPPAEAAAEPAAEPFDESAAAPPAPEMVELPEAPGLTPTAPPAPN